jgi:hypothetical protein
MKKDTEVKLLMQERRKGTRQRLAAARAGMSERTARKYEKAGQLSLSAQAPAYLGHAHEPIRRRLALGDCPMRARSSHSRLHLVRAVM